MGRMIYFSTNITARKRIVFNPDSFCSWKYFFFFVKEQETSLVMLPLVGMITVAFPDVSVGVVSLINAQDLCNMNLLYYKQDG